MIVAPMGDSFAQALIMLLCAAFWLLGAAWLIVLTIRRAAIPLPQPIVCDPLFAGTLRSDKGPIRSSINRSIAFSRAPPLLFVRPPRADFAGDRLAICLR